MDDVDAFFKSVPAPAAKEPVKEPVKLEARPEKEATAGKTGDVMEDVDAFFSTMPQPKSETSEKPVTTTQSIKQAVSPYLHGVAPTLASGGLGAVAGFFTPVPGGAAGGALLGTTSQQAADAGLSLANLAFKTDFKTPSDMTSHVLEKLGFPRPSSEADNLKYGAAKLVAETASLGGLGKAAVKTGIAGATKGSRFVKGLAEAMSDEPVAKQVLKALGVGAAAEGTRWVAEEAGMSPRAAAWMGLGTGATVASLPSAIRYAQKARAAQSLKQGAEGASDVLKASISDPEAVERNLVNFPVVSASGNPLPLTIPDVVGDPKLLSLQKDVLPANVEQRALEIAAEKRLAGEVGSALSSTKEGTAPISRYAETQYNELKNAIEREKTAALAMNDEVSQARLAELEKSLTAHAESAASKRIPEQEALDAAKQALEDTRADIRAHRDIQIREAANMEAADSLNELAKLEQKTIVSPKYDLIQQEHPNVPVEYNNVADTIEKELKALGKGWEAPKALETLAKNLKDFKGVPPAAQVIADRKGLASAWEEAARGMNSSHKRIIKELMNAVDADLEAAAPEVARLHKDAKKAHMEWAERYQDFGGKEMFKDFAYDSKSMDAMMRTAEGRSQIAKMIQGKADPESWLPPEQLQAFTQARVAAKDAVRRWTLNNMANALGDASGVNALERWLDKGGRALKNNFPWVAKDVQDLEIALRDRAGRLGRATQLLKEVDNEIQSSGRTTNEVYRTAKAKIESESRNAISEIISRAQEKAADLNNQVFTKFTGGARADQAVAELMKDSRLGEAKTDELLKFVSQDSSGKAREALENATREWLNSQIRSEAKPTVGIGKSAATLSPDDLKLSLANLNNVLVEGSPQRNVLLKILGEDQLRVLDEARAYFDTLAKRKSVEGLVTPRELKNLNGASTEVLKDNALYVIGALGFHHGFFAKAAGKVARWLMAPTALENAHELIQRALVDPEFFLKLKNTPMDVIKGDLESLHNAYALGLLPEAALNVKGVPSLMDSRIQKGLDAARGGEPKQEEPAKEEEKPAPPVPELIPVSIPATLQSVGSPKPKTQSLPIQLPNPR